MKQGHVLRSWLALYMMLSSGCLTSAETVRDEVEPAVAELSCGEHEEAQTPEPPAAFVQVEALPQGSVRLHFPPVGVDASLQRFTREDARRILQLFHEELAALEESKRRVSAAGNAPIFAQETGSVEELLPEPIFTKAFAAGVTVVLVSAFTMTELAHAGGAALSLYQATRHVQTLGGDRGGGNILRPVRRGSGVESDGDCGELWGGEGDTQADARRTGEDLGGDKEPAEAAPALRAAWRRAVRGCRVSTGSECRGEAGGVAHGGGGSGRHWGLPPLGLRGWCLQTARVQLASSGNEQEQYFRYARRALDAYL